MFLSNGMSVRHLLVTFGRLAQLGFRSSMIFYPTKGYLKILKEFSESKLNFPKGPI